MLHQITKPTNANNWNIEHFARGLTLSCCSSLVGAGANGSRVTTTSSKPSSRKGLRKSCREIMGNYDNFLCKHGSSLGMEAILAGCHLAREICILMYSRVFPPRAALQHKMDTNWSYTISWESDRWNNSTSKDPKQQVILGYTYIHTHTYIYIYIKYYI